MLRRLALGLAMTVALASPARAWDDFGHMEVAAAAYKKLAAKTRTRVDALLKLNPHYNDWIVGAKKRDQPRVAFLRAATWADAIKSDRLYKDDDQKAATAGQNIGYADVLRHKYWHFVDKPFSLDGTPLVDAPAPNALTQLSLFKQTLCAATASDDLKGYDLVWLLHLVGDVHQPLHTVSRFDKADPSGGPRRQPGEDHREPAAAGVRRSALLPFWAPAELHAFYDDITGSGYCADEVQAAADALPKPNAGKAAISDEVVWISEGVQLAQTRRLRRAHRRWRRAVHHRRRVSEGGARSGEAADQSGRRAPGELAECLPGQVERATGRRRYRTRAGRFRAPERPFRLL